MISNFNTAIHNLNEAVIALHAFALLIAVLAIFDVTKCALPVVLKPESPPTLIALHNSPILFTLVTIVYVVVAPLAF